jgi:hypothetical protein
VVVDDSAERVETEAPLPDMLVAIDAAAERFLRVVQVKHLQAIESHQTSELFECRRVAFGRTDVIAGRDQVTRVQADADAAMVVHLGDDHRELLERRAERGALTGRVLQQDHRLAAAASLQQLEQPFRDQLESFRFAADRVAARMQHHAEQPECLRAIELVAHCFHRSPAQSRNRRRQVDQITGV